eukprot:gene5758-7165_t
MIKLQQQIIKLLKRSTSLERLEITIIINDTERKLPQNLNGWIPNSVKSLRIQVRKESSFEETPPFDYSSLFKVGTLPNSIEKLEIEHLLFKHNPDILPDSVTDLTILNWDPEDINTDQYIIKPTGSVRKLEISENRYLYDQINILGRIPDTVSELILGIQFDISNGVLPHSIKKLSLMHLIIPFSLEDIPNSVEDLTIYIGWEDQITSIGSIHFGVKNLFLHLKEMPLYPSTLPNSIKSLELYTIYSIVPNQIPSSTEYIFFSYCELIEPGSIPNGVKEIKFGRYAHPFSKCTFPPSVKSIEFYEYNLKLFQDGILPHSLTRLKIERGEPQRLPPNISTMLPSLEYLECFIEDICYPLPNSLKTLVLIEKVKHIDVGMIPSSVKKIIFKDEIEFSMIEGVLPPFLNHLELKFGNVLIPFPILPHSLEYLNIRFEYGVGIEIPIGGLPESLNHLEIFNYNHPFRKGVLPENIKILDLGACDIQDIYIPNSVQELRIFLKHDDRILFSKFMEMFVLNSTFHMFISMPGLQ